MSPLQRVSVQRTITGYPSADLLLCTTSAIHAHVTVEQNNHVSSSQSDRSKRVTLPVRFQLRQFHTWAKMALQGGSRDAI